MDFDYILVTLVGKHKLYSAPLFWKYIEGLNIQPGEILVSSTKEIFNLFMKPYKGRTPVRWVHGEDDTGNDQIESTTSAREKLRQEILETPYVWSAWLDNDILVPPDYIEKFQKFLEKYPDAVLVNSFHPARQRNERMRHGLGSSFIHRDVLSAYPFTMATLRGKNLGDDYLWKILMSQFSSIFGFKMPHGAFFNVKHAIEDGSVREFDENDRGDLI